MRDIQTERDTLRTLWLKTRDDAEIMREALLKIAWVGAPAGAIARGALERVDGQ